MKHRAIEQVIRRAEDAKSDSDFTFFFSQLLAAEALAKTIVAGIIASIADDKERNRYRLEHALVRADGLGVWGQALEDAVSGVASQHLLVEATKERAELTKPCKAGEWQHDAVTSLKEALDHLRIDAENVPIKSDMKRWFRLFATLRNKTRAHGATQPSLTGTAGEHIKKSIAFIYNNFALFDRAWSYLHQNLSGKYRVSAITEGNGEFDYLKSSNEHQLANGIHVFFDSPRYVSLIHSEPELQDFYFCNGGLKWSNQKSSFELLSYLTDDKISGDASPFLTPPGNLPNSKTEGHGELLARGNCFSNAPDGLADYVERNKLESELENLLLDKKRSIITLVGRGGIGKTSLALRVIRKLFSEKRYSVIVWFSARDVDLTLEGPRSVRASVFTVDDLAKYYASLVLSDEATKQKNFKPREFFENQLQKHDVGSCLFVFDNFETMQNPIEMFKWIDTYVYLPNKVLITTRLREFKGDYPVEVGGMSVPEARELVNQTANLLGVTKLLSEGYIQELIEKSEGHPYVIKILLGEVSKRKKAANIPRMVAGTEDILTALFERTYAVLSPCAQRAFLTLSAWSSPVPQIALEAVLIRSTQERSEVELGIEALLQFSIAERHVAEADSQIFISLPLVAREFGKKKLNISTAKAAIKSDVEILRMLGPTTIKELNIGFVRRIEHLIGNISRSVEKGADFADYVPILESICRSYNPGWLVLAKWHMEAHRAGGYESAKEALRRFLENDSSSDVAAEAWRLLARACYQTSDALGEVHAYIERAQFEEVPFLDLSNTANRLNGFLKDNSGTIDREVKHDLVDKIASVLRGRRAEAGGDDLSRMAWLEIHRGQEYSAIEYVRSGLDIDPDNYHLRKLAERLGISS